MTREGAIRILDPDTTGETLAEIEYYGGFNRRNGNEFVSIVTTGRAFVTEMRIST